MTRQRLFMAFKYLGSDETISELVHSLKVTINALEKEKVLDWKNTLFFLKTERDRVRRCSCYNCILAHVWTQPGKSRVEVSFEDCRQDLKILYHPYGDVVNWFDNFEDDLTACKTVLELIEEN